MGLRGIREAPYYNKDSRQYKDYVCQPAASSARNTNG